VHEVEERCHAKRFSVGRSAIGSGWGTAVGGTNAIAHRHPPPRTGNYGAAHSPTGYFSEQRLAPGS
jgi:hypothetical protein